MAVEESLPPVRFLLLRIVTVGGMYDWPRAEPPRGEACGGVEVGAGSFDRAELTRCSSFCIFPIRPRIWCSEPEEETPGVLCRYSWRPSVDRRLTDGVWRSLLIGIEGPRECRGGRDECVKGRGVAVEFDIERRDLMNG